MNKFQVKITKKGKRKKACYRRLVNESANLYSYWIPVSKKTAKEMINTPKWDAVQV